MTSNDPGTVVEAIKAEAAKVLAKLDVLIAAIAAQAGGKDK